MRQYTKTNMIGERYGKLVVTAEAERVEERKRMRVAWTCTCDCGNTLVATRDALKKGDVRSCGCAKRGVPFTDLTGKQLGNLKVIHRGPNITSPNGKVIVRWWCLCGCGTGKLMRMTSLTSKRRPARSCGCSKQHKDDEAVMGSLYTAKRYGATMKRDLEWSLTVGQFKELVTQNCHYCGVPPSQEYRQLKRKILYTGIDRLDNTIGYVPGNCVPCCGHCNAMKLTLSYDEFLDKITHIYNNVCTIRSVGVLKVHTNPGVISKTA